MAEKKRTENARLTKSAGKEIGDDEGHIGGEYKIQENPEFLAKRLEIYNRIMALRQEEQKKQPREPIKITLPDGKVKEGTSFETSPMDIAKEISEGLANQVIISKVFYSKRIGTAEDVADSSGFEVEDEADEINKGELWDLERPLEGDCKLELLKFDEQEAKMVFWHSSAHVLGECLECCYGTCLTVGPPIDPGFYYDCYMGKETLKPDDVKKLQAKAGKINKSKQKFERIVLTKDEALEMFADNPFKVSIIKNKIKDGSLTTAYRCGDLIDLCMGPHIPHTGKIKAFEVTKQSASYWLGDVKNDPLQRVYGISFPDKKLLKEHKEFMKHAAENDHRKKGIEQDLFFFHNLSPGSCFFQPRGARVYNTLMDYIKMEYRNRGYDEVITPNIFNVDLWKQSGHWQHYQEHMFAFSDNETNATTYALKPMNCPGHCLMFKHNKHSYRELPIRMADFGVLHRNELSGALTGLTRVRRFQQDDAHIFCRADQVKEEVYACLEFMKSVYTTFGMTYKLERSTRPKKACGLETDEGKALWDSAEAALAEALDEFVGAGNWRDNPGDGAFYGPKIDIKVFDVMKRAHQTATIQLDFQLPLRFGLEYATAGRDGEGKEVLEPPVIVHRAMLGSLERSIAILTEHYAGKWPFWLSPRQCIVVPVSQTHEEYADEVQKALMQAGFYCDVDRTSNTLNKKILLSQKAQYNFILVVGNDEIPTKSVNIRSRANERIGVKTITEFIAMCTELKVNRTPDSADAKNAGAEHKNKMTKKMAAALAEQEAKKKEKKEKTEMATKES